MFLAQKKKKWKEGEEEARREVCTRALAPLQKDIRPPNKKRTSLDFVARRGKRKKKKKKRPVGRLFEFNEVTGD